MFTYTPGLFGIPVPRLDEDYYDSNLLVRCYFIVGRSLRHTWPNVFIDTVPRTEHLKNPNGQPPRMDPQGMERTLTRDAQAACCFKCLASKFAFFHIIRVIAAIFLAKVRRAIVGFAPLASKAS